MVFTIEMLGEILDYLDKSIEKLASEAFENLEIEGRSSIENFLENQFDVRLENMLVVKKSSVHHLESGMKNTIIQRKQIILGKISNQYKN